MLGNVNESGLPAQGICSYYVLMSRVADTLKHYPSPKVEVACALCGRKGRYDRDDLLRAGGDRKLSDLLDAIARRWECDRATSYEDLEFCGLAFSNVPEAAPATNAYALAKGL